MDTNITDNSSIVLNLERDWDFVCRVTIPVKAGSEPIGFSIYAEKANIAFKHIIYDGVTTKSTEDILEALKLALEGLFKVVLERRSDVILNTHIIKEYDEISKQHYIKEDAPDGKTLAVTLLNYDTAMIYDNLCVLADYLSDTAESGSYSAIAVSHDLHANAYGYSIGKTLSENGSVYPALLKPLYLDCYHLEDYSNEDAKSIVVGFNTRKEAVEMMARHRFIGMTIRNKTNFLSAPSLVCDETIYQGTSKGYCIRILGMEIPLAIFREKEDAVLFAKKFIKLVEDQIATTLTC
jgi:hypothetical protein|nr:MAG TPA: hypothetical protein [Bacteriophage sp.]